MMAGFWERMLGRGGKGSGATAKQRLQFVLFHDRINLPPERLEMMKKEILAVISKYVAIDEDHVDIALQQGDRRGSMLVAEIPFTRPAEGIEQDDSDSSKEASPALLELSIPLNEEVAEDVQNQTLPEENSDENDKTQPHKL
ncbi:MAG: cell division topological specificity factor MinE [Anaerolineae bacterium]